MPFGVTLAITGVALLLLALIFKRPKSLVDGDAGLPALQDLTCTFQHLPEWKLAVKSAAPLLPGLNLTLAPRPLKRRAT